MDATPDTPEQILRQAAAGTTINPRPDTYRPMPA